jgi:hypothetical protein
MWRMKSDTGRQMLASGMWAKVGGKHYRLAGEIDVRYDCNRWLWMVEDGTGYGFDRLWVAREWAEKALTARVSQGVR